jgi:predicted transcriptional regulator
MAKINISVPDSLLEAIDKRAEESQRTRSGFIQDAAAAYLSRIETEEALTARSERILAAYAQMREVAKEMPPGSRGVDLIRRFRDIPEPWLTGDDDQAEADGR